MHANINQNGEITPPCLTPLVTLTYEDVPAKSCMVRIYGKLYL